MKILYLSLSDIVTVGMNFADAVDIIEQSFREHGEKQVENPPKLPIHPLPDAFINAMPSFLPRKKVCGVKWISGFPTNVQKGMQSILGLMILNDVETGVPLVVMDSTYITMLRTIAVSAVAAKHLCNEDAEIMSIVGCGVQGKNHAIVMSHLLPSLRVARIHDLYSASVEGFQKEISTRVPRLRIEVCPSAEAAIRGADLVITATGKLLKPIFKNEWVKEGALVLPVHTLGWDSTTASAMDKLVVDDWDQYRTVGEIWYQPLPAQPYAETGEIVAGLKPGRESAEERIVNFNKGMAVHDILMGNAFFQRARKQGLGTQLELFDPTQSVPLIEV